jgi:tetratricopeptide (TPR) repeat protein
MNLVLALIALLAASPSGKTPPLALPGGPELPSAARHRPPRALPATLEGVLGAYPADSLVKPLRQFELDHGRAPEGADAAFTLGQLHYARGEYRQAFESFSRAAARYAPERKQEARYWQGLSALGMRDAPQARSALEELAEGSGPRSAEARFGVSIAWEQAGRPERAREILEPLVNGPPSDVTPAALEQLVSLATRQDDAATARRAADRLRKEYPQSLEAMRLPQPPRPAEVPAADAGAAEKVGIQIGAFSESVRAKSLLDEARRAGFSRSEMAAQGQGEARLYVVRVGWYASEAEARKAGERASQALGVAYRLVRRP